MSSRAAFVICNSSLMAAAEDSRSPPDIGGGVTTAGRDALRRVRSAPSCPSIFRPTIWKSDVRRPKSDDWLLVTGCWLLITGCWLLVTDYWLLGSCQNRSRRSIQKTPLFCKCKLGADFPYQKLPHLSCILQFRCGSYGRRRLGTAALPGQALAKPVCGGLWLNDTNPK